MLQYLVTMDMHLNSNRISGREMSEVPRVEWKVPEVDTKVQVD